ncbi:MAG: type II toxin-antitoxin system VapC family toxin [Microbacterium sp.]|uniref:type II toxin-antitoxin system VapC family toxin n=1 Tax=Microbacterium sp. TaxID=51671 RepID=UPI003A884B41
MSTIWRLVRTSQISADEGDRGLALLRHAPIRRIDAVDVSAEAWMLRQSVRITDAFYIAAARLLSADLLTSDGRLSRAPSLGVTVVLLR